ncbi:MAG: tRNA (N(6)-L-threonylcarbamoyladenosine(37)-C(2))-methylthiotransferase MtaB [Verrucomicrobiota bacterium]|nr:tRNA (N(6)-L-threonylcarbamoyladenosine(37)-C(2))-methylthiotransferase MtaB [Verrucomicrobiota bacterium]
MLKTVAIYTLGCRLNQAETALTLDRFKKNGFSVTDWKDGADIMIINSCIVTGNAERKSRRLAKQTKKKFQDSFLVLTGCAPSKKNNKWTEDDYIDLKITNAEKTNLIEHLPKDKFSLSPKLDVSEDKLSCDHFIEDATGYYPNTTRANIKIQEGCDFRCSYCIIPDCRGLPRSRSKNDILKEFQELLKRGHKEIVLTGINTALYNDSGCDLADLLFEMSKKKGDFRLRLSSVEPIPSIMKLIPLIKESPKICRFLHLPIQYGENTILKAMNRRYDIKTFVEYANTFAKKIPNICLGTDVIVGFPGEKDIHFEECLKIIDNLPFSYLHVFSFSPRPGTPAEQMPEKVPKNLKKQRHKKLAKLANKKSQDFIEKNIGLPLKVLVENDAPYPSGWSDNYIRINIPDSPKKGENYFAEVILNKHEKDRKGEGVLIR